MVFGKIFETWYEKVMNNPERLEKFSNPGGKNGLEMFVSLLIAERR